MYFKPSINASLFYIKDNVESASENVESEKGSNLQESLLNEMQKSKLHNNNKPRNTQDKVDQISANKKKQKEELSEMQDKAQVNILKIPFLATQLGTNINISESIFYYSDAMKKLFYVLEKVISRGARMSAADVLSSITNTETDFEESNEKVI